MEATDAELEAWIKDVRGHASSERIMWLAGGLERLLAEKQAAIKERDGLTEVLNASEQRKRELIEENRVLREGIAVVYKQGRCGCGGYGYHDADCAHKKLRDTVLAADALRDKPKQKS